MREALIACAEHKPSLFIYMSVAQVNIPVMKDYRLIRAEGERLIQSSGIPFVFLRPWYVIGPGHYWPLVFLPLFWLSELIPFTAARAKSIRLVRLKSVLRALVKAVEGRTGAVVEIGEMGVGDRR